MPSVRPLGFRPVLALVVGGQIGTGIYILAATPAPLGVNPLVAWMVSAVVASRPAFVVARSNAALPLAGGVYAFARPTFRPATGFAFV